MNKSMRTAIVYYIASVACFVAAGIYMSGGEMSMGPVWLGVGGVTLCIGTMWMIKGRSGNNRQ